MRHETGDLSGLTCAFYQRWDHRKDKLKHVYAIDGWYCSVIPEIQKDIEERGTRWHCNQIKLLITKLHSKPCPNKNRSPQGKLVADMEEGKLLAIFWEE